MKKNNIFFAATLVVAIFGGELNSMAQATATAGAGANIIAPISMIKTVDMNFGNIAVSVATGGTVILSPSGTRSTGGSGGVTLPVTAGTVAAAGFTVSGNSSYTYAITLPSAVTITSGSHNMTLNSFNSSPSLTGLLSSGGTQNLTVGAVLNVTANQTPGTYTNVTGVPVTVNYN